MKPSSPSGRHHSSSHRRPPPRQFTDDLDGDDGAMSMRAPQRPAKPRSGRRKKENHEGRSTSDPYHQSSQVASLQPPSGVARGGSQPRYYEDDEELARRHQQYYDEEDRKIRARRSARNLATDTNEQQNERRDRDGDAQDQQYHANTRDVREIPVAPVEPANVARAAQHHHKEYHYDDEEDGDDNYYPHEQDQHYYKEDRKMSAREDDLPREILASRQTDFPKEVPETSHRASAARGSRGVGAYFEQQDRKAKRKSKKKDDTVTLGQFSTRAEEKTEEPDSFFDMRPGASRIPGATPGHYRDGVSFVTGETQDAIGPSPRSGDANLIHAFLVNEEEERRAREQELQERLRLSQQQQRQREPELPLRVDAKAVEYKPWYKRAPVLIGLGIIAAAALGIGLGVGLTQDGGTTTTIVEDFPTASPAPTALTEITVVLQLDENPAETGWSLECDRDLVRSVPQGSYAFLPIGLLIPSYRLEITALVEAGSQCVYNITDAGGDGLIGGFYEVFYGTDSGDAGNRLRRGNPLSAINSIVFNVIPPPLGAPPTPTAPTPPAPPSIIQGCTVCPDGSPVPNPDAFLGDNSMTCGELDNIARNVLNSTQCFEIQESATECGCQNFCNTVCPDNSLVDPSVENKLVKVENGRLITCGALQEQVMIRNSTKSDCLSANFLGEEVCECPPTGIFCRICQSGEVPVNLTKEIIPGVACGDISGIAYSLLRSNPLFADICPACLSIGEYCGCPPPAQNPRVFCRLCGDRLLPDTDRLVFSPLLNMTTTCFHIEFYSNLGVMPDGTTSVIPDCSVVQEQSSAECCAA